MRRFLGVVVFALVVSVAPCALAGPPAEAVKQAQVLFDEGRRLVDQKRYAEACPKFVQSQELDPGMGTQFRLAECYEKLGKLASAYEQYIAVAEAARAAKKPDREAVAQKRATALEPKIPRLTIDVPASVSSLDGVEVSRDGKPVEKRLWGTPVPVDAGDHTVAVKAPGRVPWEGKVTLEGTGKLSLSVPALEPVPVEKPPPPPPRRSTVPAIALGVGGGVGIAVGATFLGLRAAKASSAHTLHDKIVAQKGTCLGGGQGAFASDCAALASATSAGDTFGTVSILGFAAFGAAAAGMVTYLLLPDPKPASARVQVAPVVGRGEGGVVAWGTF
jgi:hypothetical protein